MKTKKFVSALLALVMVLSIAPISAFAATTSCGHFDVEERSSFRYIDVDSTKHTRITTYTSTCRVCGHVSVSEYREDLSHKFVKTLVDEYEESGETVYVYVYRCACGRVQS